ncbi:MAG: c-type cytochrome [Gaiellales bacterium]
MLRCPIRKAVAIALTALACAAGWSGFAATSSPGKGDPAAGKKIFLVKCVACHKADGSGGVKLTGNATPNWRDAKRMADPKFDDDYLRDCITNGKTKSGMVAWKSQIKPADIENLIAHIRSFAKK